MSSLADASISPVEVAVFQLRRSKLQIVRSTENVPTVDVCRSRRDVGIHLARRLLSFSQSRAAFQFKIVDHVGKVYLTVSCVMHRLCAVIVSVPVDHGVSRYTIVDLKTKWP